MAVSSVKEERARLLLPKRQAKDVKRKHLTVYFDDDLWTKMQRASFGRFTTMAEYVRGLIRRDVGMNPT